MSDRYHAARRPPRERPWLCAYVQRRAPTRAYALKSTCVGALQSAEHCRPGFLGKGGVKTSPTLDERNEFDLHGLALAYGVSLRESHHAIHAQLRLEWQRR